MMLNFSFFPGAFLFPFIIMLVILGLPLLFLETAFGQFASTGVISIWKVSPIFKGKFSFTSSEKIEINCFKRGESMR